MLDLSERPQISISSVKANYNEGTSVNISCAASGKPEPDVKWIGKGKEMISGKKSAFLTFNGIQRGDDGQYTCKANNSAGIDEDRVPLMVHCK